MRIYIYPLAQNRTKSEKLLTKLVKGLVPKGDGHQSDHRLAAVHQAKTSFLKHV